LALAPVFETPIWRLKKTFGAGLAFSFPYPIAGFLTISGIALTQMGYGLPQNSQRREKRVW
jgi:hypothetical protein